VAVAVLVLQTNHFILTQSPQLQLRPKDCNVEELTTSVDESFDPTLLTLFTSMKDSEHRRTIQNRTINNWASFAPFVKPVLYADSDTSSELTSKAQKMGWEVRNVPMYRHGIPVFKLMFLDAITNYDTPYYAFANADILFDGSLLETLQTLREMNVTDQKCQWTGSPDITLEKMTNEELLRRPSSGGLLIIGRRTNVDEIYFDSSPSLREKAKSQGSMFLTYAQDYFITTKHGLPWEQIPDLVIGRPGYDNWLTARAMDWKCTTIDVTEMLLAVHQTGSDGNKAGWSNKKDTVCVNLKLAGFDFDYRPGHTKCCSWVAQRDISGTMRVVKRLLISKDCQRIGKLSARAKLSRISRCKQ
jgi:hypothetical protein